MLNIKLVGKTVQKKLRCIKAVHCLVLCEVSRLYNNSARFLELLDMQIKPAGPVRAELHSVPVRISKWRIILNPSTASGKWSKKNSPRPSQQKLKKLSPYNYKCVIKVVYIWKSIKRNKPSHIYPYLSGYALVCQGYKLVGSNISRN